jgi:cellulose synthase/poly-beta-1,6-N-acetylglucosamine synthase-like glycosyltransferase
MHASDPDAPVLHPPNRFAQTGTGTLYGGSTSTVEGRRPARVVVLIPAHNEEGSIAATVQALLRQERVPDRIVVVADNCTDDTVAIASSMRHEALVVTATKNNRDKKCGGLNAAWRRYAMDADIVVCLDADTVLPPHAIGDWIAEFAADPSLAGSSSKFTMRGTAFLVRLQRAEFAKWTDSSLRRGWTSVLAGTACAIRNSVLHEVVRTHRRHGPWLHASQVEDFELTYRIRELGYYCRVSPTVRAYTDAMPTIRALWGQRMKWQVGTVEDLLRFGVNRRTLLDWRQQGAGLLAAAVRFGWIFCTVLYAALGILHFAPFWFFVPLLFIANDVKQAMRIPDRDRWDLVLAALLLPQEAFAWMRACWFVAAWLEVIRARITGNRKDRWTMQYAAEAAA